MKIYIHIIIILLVSKTFAQVGFGTNSPDPAYALTVEGDVKVEDINFERALPGMVYSSNGPNAEPTWKVIASDNTSIPNLNYLLFSKSLNNFTYITPSTTSTNFAHSYDEPITGWIEMVSNQNATFKVNNVNSKVFITFESVAQVENSDSEADSGTNFSCGIFVAESLANSSNFGTYKLKGVRLFTANRGQNSHSFHNFSLSTEISSNDNFSFDNTRTYDVKVACKRRNNFGGYTNGLRIGGNLQTNINSFSTRSFLKINVFEPTN